MTARAVIVASVVCCFFAACEARLDVLSPAGSTPRDGGATPIDARVVDIPDATPPPDAMPSLPDVVMPPDHTVTELVASYADTCAIANGTLYCWGLLPDASTTLSPTRIAGAVAGVYRHVSNGETAHCVTRDSGLAYCFGTNDRGELGQGDRTARNTPARVSLPASTGVVAGKFASFCTRIDDGRLYCWGQNDEGQMGQADVGAPQDALTPVQVGTATDWLGVATGQGHVCGVRAPGELYCWGRNTDGELGQGDGASVQLRAPARVQSAQDWTSVVAGQGHTCGIRSGRLYCFGNGGDGQLGVTPRASSNVPVEVGNGTDWLSVSTDTFHGCGIRGAGTLWCWGRNAEGQLGTGDVVDRDTPTQVGTDSNWVAVSVGRFHTCARRSDGTAWCTGANDDGQLGTGDLDRRDVFTQVTWGSG
ncbi:MAG TPA: hypothetical protein VH062_26790 [Polyangiaceae bacterium]|jgi:alpha-tubulin suppressor-like RCC1 family protein|nr:hypothetical protein [Polyangiaceae bacterium]